MGLAQDELTLSSALEKALDHNYGILISYQSLAARSIQVEKVLHFLIIKSTAEISKDHIG